MNRDPSPTNAARGRASATVGKFVTFERFTPMTVTLLAVSVGGASINVYLQFYGRWNTILAHVCAIMSPVASIALAFVAMAKIDWNRR